MTAPRAARRLRRALLAALVGLVLVDQGLQLGPLSDGRFLGRRIAPYDPPFFNPQQRQYRDRVAAIVAGDAELAARSLFDPELGWCPRPETTWLESTYDWAGCRIAHAPLARTRTPGRRRVVAIGGSFTEGAEVSGTETWIARLEEARPDLEVANLGVSGYGVDQALLRLRRDGLPLGPDEVWLGLLPSGAERVTTVYPPAANHWSAVAALKPRFRGGDSLELVPLPVRDAADTLHLLSDAEAFWTTLAPLDPWIGAWPAAWKPRGSSWTHRSGLARLLVTGLEARGRGPERFLGAPDSPTRALMARLVSEIDAAVRGEGARFRVLVLPARHDLASARTSGRPYWRDWAEQLGRDGVEVIDLAETLLAGGADLDDAQWRPMGHYGPQLNARVAEHLDAALRE
jgi:hypothetical protein